MSEEPQKIKRGDSGLAIKAGFWYVISTFLVKGLSFITTPVFSRLLTKAEYGEFSNFASWQALLLIITSMEMQNTVARAYYDYKKDFDKYVSSVTIVSCAFTFLLYILFLLCGDWALSIVSIPKQYVHILFFMLMFQACKQIYMSRERTMYRYKSVAVISVVNLLLPTLIAVALVVLANHNGTSALSARIYGFYVPSALIGLGCAAVLLRKGKSFRWSHCKYALALSLPLMVHYFTAHLLTSSNTIVTKNVLGAVAVSVVSIASSANHILTILLQSVSGAVTTWLMDNLELKDVKAVRKGTLAYVAGISVVALGVILLAPEVIWVLGGSKYAEAMWLMPGMVVAVLIQSATTIFTIMLTYQKKVVRTALYTGIMAVLCIVAKIYLLPIFGVQSLPFLNMAAFLALFVINYLLVRKAGLGKYVPIKAIAGILAGLLLLMFVSYFLYMHTWLRYTVIGLMAVAAAVVAYRYRGMLLKIIRKKFKKKSKSKKQEKTEE